MFPSPVRWIPILLITPRVGRKNKSQKKMADTFAKYHCNYCEEDINGLRVRCLECDDFDLCLQCFACGAQIGKHKATHGYQFMASVFQDTGNFSVLNGQGQWTAREEVRLLDAIEQYGYGNWDDIAKHIETRTPEEAKAKYINCYIDGPVGKLTWKVPLENRQNLPTENTSLDAGPLSPTLGSSLPNQELTTEETTILGYMINRDDFEREWDNDAENTIAPLFIHPVDDDEIDMALKLAQVDMYIRRLRERARRKRVVRDFHLAQQFFKKEKEKNAHPPFKKKPKDEKEILYDKLKPISQFQTALEHQNFINSLCREKELKMRIKELLRYRRNGIQHVEECSEFEVARTRRDKKKENKKKGTISLQTQTTASDSLARSRDDEKSPRSSAERRSTVHDIGVGKWLSGSLSDSSTSSNSSNTSSSSHQQQPQQMAVGGTDDIVDITTLPGYHLLSIREKKLCASLNLKPSQYISYKTFLLKEEGERQLSGGMQNSRPPSTPFGLDTRSQVHVSSFIAQAGWISLCS